MDEPGLGGSPERFAAAAAAAEMGLVTVLASLYGWVSSLLNRGRPEFRVLLHPLPPVSTKHRSNYKVDGKNFALDNSREGYKPPRPLRAVRTAKAFVGSGNYRTNHSAGVSSSSFPPAPNAPAALSPCSGSIRPRCSCRDRLRD